MEIRAGYKQTEVGVIPEDWDVIPIGQISECFIGLTYSPLDVREFGTLVLRSSNIQDGKLAFDDNVFVDMEIPVRAITHINDILICVRNGSRHLIGKCALIDDETAGSAFGAFMSVLRSESAHFLFYQFQSDILKKQINDVMGATINQITNKDMVAFKVNLPPNRAEQEAIAEALSDADALIESLEQIIAKKRAIKQGAMQELLRPKKTWVERLLGKSAVLKARIGWQGLTTAEYLKTGDYYLVTGTDFKNGYIDWNNCPYVEEIRYKQDKNIQLKQNDVLVTKDGTIGKIALVGHLDIPATLNSGIFVIRPIEDAFRPEFFYYLLCSNIFSEFLSQLSAGSTINHLYQKDFVNFTYKTPRALSEQASIAQALSDMDNEIEALESKLQKARQLKQGMMQELLTGRIRLV